jgi:uncharacterized FlaG/YvyC family protein
MKVTLEPLQNALAADTSAPKVQASRQSTSPAPHPASEIVAKQIPPPPVPAQPAVTFRKDSAGKIYYVITDSQSGKEIRQIPADAVRKASEGIDEFLKQVEAKEKSHLKVKA